MKTTRRGRPARPSGARRRGAPRRVAPVGCVRMGGARRRPLEPYGGFLVRALKRLTFARCRGGRRTIRVKSRCVNHDGGCVGSIARPRLWTPKLER